MAFQLGSGALAGGYRLDVFDTVGSTNAEAMRAARAGDAGKHWFVAHRQEQGRGRRGRPWVMPEGNLAASLLLVCPNDPATAATLGFAAGLALDEALRAVAPDLTFHVGLDGFEGEGAPGSNDRLRLKWPNDVLLDGAKLAGILLEAEPVSGGKLAVVIGIGVNVRATPADLPYPAASLASLGVGLDAPLLFRALSDAWASVERVWDGGRGFRALRRLWLDRAAGLGEDVAVRVGGEVFSGIFETIDDEGRLIIRSREGVIRTIAAGEVHFGAVASSR
ncbi:biotin--[acetyl-CoA-carboxylase] ligase [Kaistia dalseonensis]|uniref:biotin--[biotin carboxyl-carrier protein] ligase n=1 Tax=Kaistia dalseonensis TaxID=410840 RepID=A0ABU0H085_9HYPH|nr:biotin--[acetyl-CoA-carboxylase] ligase [Kaistia dalseonensis]MCX5493165.1 biotin--[acetyl-CoA-carboxylase] ligase [Kaistia dalseonensis]MDQ0435720.1 BirA family biotin operon repressor/biotin-[acetyl-CoA-carboxylase] ligase [Kaistia dalseonensis]